MRTTVLTRDAVLTLALHLKRLHVDALVPYEASARDSPVWLTKAFVTRSGERKQRTLFSMNISSNSLSRAQGEKKNLKGSV